MHFKVKKAVERLLEKAAQYRMPDSWEDTIELLSGEKEIILKKLEKGSLEWKDIELNFKMTMPDSKILMIHRV